MSCQSFRILLCGSVPNPFQLLSTFSSISIHFHSTSSLFHSASWDFQSALRPLCSFHSLSVILSPVQSHSLPFSHTQYRPVTLTPVESPQSIFSYFESSQSLAVLSSPIPPTPDYTHSLSRSLSRSLAVPHSLIMPFSWIPSAVHRRVGFLRVGSLGVISL